MLRLSTVALSISLSFATISMAADESAVRPAVDQTGGRLLTRSEGMALVGYALQEHVANRAPDCSHLVHQVLTSAGLPYPYAPSFAIFAGIPQFRRVVNPQPGDLIVWRGHVGLVVDPERRTFFSRTGSGPGTHEYDSGYWRARGQPRFYRYVVSGGSRPLAEQAAYVAKASTPNTAVESEDPSIPSSEVDAAPADLFARSRPDPIPESIQILAEHGKPAREDVEEGLSELANGSANVLENQDRRPSVIFVRELRVERIETRGNKGWAEVHVDSRAELSPELTWKRARPQTIRWQLLKDQDGWQLMAPKTRLYIPQSAAVPLLAKQLSTLSVAPVPADRQRQIGRLASLLNFLLNQQ